MTNDESQDAIVENTEGMMVVDAGPGTGKTHTVIRRCLGLLRRKDIGKDDVVMLTFTRNAAEEMRDRLMQGISDLYFGKDGDSIDEETYKRMTLTAEGMKVQTFDSYCLGIVKSSPGHISKFFRFDKEALTHSTSIVENESVNRTYFRRFLDHFLDVHGKDYGDLAAIAQEDPTSMYKLIERLMARGILPLRKNEDEDDGIGRWFGGNDGKDLLGDMERLRGLMDKWKPDKKIEDKISDVLGLEGYSLKPIDRRMLDEAAGEDRNALLRMVHDIYYEFIRRSVGDDRLTFGLAASFAFIILYEDRETRERIQCRYLIVDEFQDTNSNQLMISLMALREPNLCVVGDWKQGIYGFRFVSIENITDFKNRVERFRRYLNDDIERIGYEIGEVRSLPLKTSYRSSQLIVDKAFSALYAAGSDDDEVDTGNITKIEAKWDAPKGMTAFETVECGSKEEEYEETARRIENYVRNRDYAVRDKDPDTKEEIARPARYSDIAVLCRTARVCKNVFLECRKHGIPAFLQGDMEVMSTREGKLLLAWLRYVNDFKDRWGIVPILADMGYSLDQIEEMLKYNGETGRDGIPDDIKQMRRTLSDKKRRITDLIATVFGFYGLDNDKTQTIMSVISKAHRSSLMTISDVINMIETDIENNTTYKMDGIPDENAITIQTMHKSKGLEYPIVIIPGIDRKAMPNSKPDRELFMFNDTVGVRCRNTVVEVGGNKLLKPSWRTLIAVKSQKIDYGEERRLLFVAVSRASQYVTVIAGNNPSRFFTHYSSMEGQELGNPLRTEMPRHLEESKTLVERPRLPEIRARRKNIGVHGIMNMGNGTASMDEPDEMIGPKGRNYGTTVHKYAELIVRGIPVDQKVSEEYPEVEKARRIIEELRRDRELDAEVECSLPVNKLNVTLRGVIDLVAIGKDTVEIHDWKNDVTKDNIEEYRVQLSVYAHVAEMFYRRKAKCCIQWLVLDDTDEFDPLPMEVIEKRTEKALTTRKD